jgi:hypothetical protein
MIACVTNNLGSRHLAWCCPWYCGGSVQEVHRARNGWIVTLQKHCRGIIGIISKTISMKVRNHPSFMFMAVASSLFPFIECDLTFYAFPGDAWSVLLFVWGRQKGVMKFKLVYTFHSFLTSKSINRWIHRLIIELQDWAGDTFSTLWNPLSAE